jgi:cobalt/nickel transport system permease protein
VSAVIEGLPAHTKVAATVVFVIAVVATPRAAVPALLVDLLLVVTVLALLRVRLPAVVRRMRIEVPFVVFALALPLVGDGWWGTWNILAKATIGVLAATALTASTSTAALLRGLERLHVPRLLVGTAMFMVRYLDVIVGDVTRLRIARVSRGDDPRWLWQARGVAATAGTLFVRSYERGERVHLAMVSRGYDGRLPDLSDQRASATDIAAAALLPVIAIALLVGASVR